MTQGYLHSEMDVKILILYILSRIETPLDISAIYEVAYQDDSLNYFTLSECLGELTDSGHISKDTANRYRITEKGVKQGAVLADSLAAPVVHRVSEAIEKKLIQIQLAKTITADVTQDDSGRWYSVLCYQDDGIPLLTVSLQAPGEEIARGMADNLLKNLPLVYKSCMDAAMDVGRKPITEPKE